MRGTTEVSGRVIDLNQYRLDLKINKYKLWYPNTWRIILITETVNNIGKYNDTQASTR